MFIVVQPYAICRTVIDATDVVGKKYVKTVIVASRGTAPRIQFVREIRDD
jgi:hypothetical protein